MRKRAGVVLAVLLAMACDPDLPPGSYVWAPNEVRGQLTKSGNQCVLKDGKWQPYAFTERKTGHGGVQTGELRWKVTHDCGGATLAIGNLRRLTVCAGSAVAANCTPAVGQCLPPHCPPPVLDCTQALEGTQSEFQCDVTNAVDGLYKYDLRVTLGGTTNTYDPVIEIGDWKP
jgi:hypothetical protein